MTRTVRECSILNFRMGLVLAIMLWALSCPLSLFAAVVNGDFSVTPGNEGFGWELEGDVTVAGGAAVLTEGAAYPTSIWQTFTVPAGVRYILFTLKTLDLKANAEGTEPDSFQVSLLKDSALRSPAVDPISTLSNTAALFSVQQTGELHYAQAVSVPGAAASGSAWSADNLPATVSVDLGTLTGEGAVTLYLYFDLLGADATGSTATIADVKTIAPPVAVNDSIDEAEADEDTAVVIDVLANDTDADGAIDPKTVTVTVAPQHGQTAVDGQTGVITYTPALNYHGADSFKYTVKDDTGYISNEAVVTVTVASVNDAPVADAGDDQTVDEGTMVTLDGSGSSDIDSDTLYYLWEQLDGTTTVTLPGATSAAVTFTAPDVGPGGVSLRFRLTVRDRAEGGLSATDTCIVNVTWSNQPPVANAGADQTVDEGTEVTLDGSGSSDPDEGDGIKSYLWEQTGGPSVVLSDPGGVKPTFTAPAVGIDGAVLSFQLTVTDHGADYGEPPGLRDTDTCTVKVNWVNEAPTADAGTDQTVSEGAVVTLDGSASTDPDDGIASYLWEVVSTAGLIAGQTVALSDPKAVKPTFTAPRVGIGDGTVTVRFTVTDTDQGGALWDSDEMTVIIQNVVPVGDVDDSGVVDLRDAIVMLRLIVRLPVNAGEFTVRADANGDGVLALPEVLYILRKVGEI